MNLLYPFNRSLFFTLFFNSVLAVLWWLPWVFNAGQVQNIDITLFGTLQILEIKPFAALLIQFFIGVLMFFITSSISFSKQISTTSYLQFTLMILLGVLWVKSHIFGNQSIAAVFFIFSIIELLKLNFFSRNTLKIFNSLILIITASFFQIDFIFLIPLFIAGIFILEGLKIKSMVLVIFTLIIAVLTILGYAYVFDSVDVIKNYYFQVLNFRFFINWHIIDIQHIIFYILIIFTIISLYLYFRQKNNFKLQTKKIISFLIVIWLYLTFYMLFTETACKIFALVYLPVTSFLLMLNFVNYKSKTNNIIFLIFLFLLTLTYILQFFIFNI